tara:strand:+ start:879 stop:1688 length:810 start_codon:yes stop_codon:yes gene_type:complete
VIIISASRRKQLFWTLKACLRSRRKPSEIIIVHMDELLEIYHENTNIKQYRIAEGHRLPLAAARNLGAEKASTDKLIFLDVDCIPSYYCFERLLNKLEDTDVVMGTPRYLTRPIQNFKQLSKKSIDHPLKPILRSPTIEKDYNQFWSLIFTIRKRDFCNVNGFYENYKGYGAEDTDLAQKFKFHALELFRVNAVVYHQYHQVYRPPLNHFEGIVANANLFYERWNFFPMMNWIEVFEERGLVKLERGKLKILRFPDAKEIRKSKTTSAF